MVRILIQNFTRLPYLKFIPISPLFVAFFIRPFYKMIVNRPVTFKDMEAVDVEFHNSLKYIKDNDPEPLCLTFSVNKTVFGEVSVYTYCLLLHYYC